MLLLNSTHLDTDRVRAMFLRHTRPYRHDRLTVRLRYSRGADFSGSCYYRDQRIFINLGRHNRYPFRLGTHIARAVSNRTHWWRDVYTIILADAYQLALFVYLHELFHALVSAARRNTRRKEAMCDRFAARVLADAYHCPVLDRNGRRVARSDWDFQDLERFVAAAPRESAAPASGESSGGAAARGARPRPIPVVIRGLPIRRASARANVGAARQLVLPFPS